MGKFSNGVIHHKKLIIIVFLCIAAVSGVMAAFVGVNYNMVDYLPPSAQSTTALTIMDEEFGGSMPNTSVMVRNVSLEEALQYKQELSGIDGVEEVLWLDDMVDLRQPLEMADAGTVEGFYKNGNALYNVTIREGMEVKTTEAIWDLVGEEGAVSGQAPDIAAMQQATGKEVGGAVAILLPIIVAILVLSTSAWIEPLLFFAAIGISIVINMGTNLIFGEISFMTNSVSPILQLAVSLDYAIFFLHSFGDNRRKYADVNEAMRHSIKQSIPTVAASALTTLFGFLALSFMNFRIGADLGLTLAKGIILSFVSCMIFLPALTLVTYKAIDRTRHRPLMPSFKNIDKVVSKMAIPAIILVALLIVPSFLGQAQTGFIYGNGSADVGSESSKSKAEIQEEFGQSTVMALLVPKGDVASELALSEDLERLDHVTGVMSYANTVGTAIPSDFLGTDVTSQFYSDHYARIVVYTDTPEEGDLAFTAVEDITKTAQSYYGDTVYSAGQSANLYDMKEVVTVDNSVVTVIAVLAILAVLFITFRSALIPLILLLTIETGIWVNLAIPYFSGTSINFIGYLVINTVQLGATVDYAILLTNTYMAKRRRLPKGPAMADALGSCFKSILVSGLTLATAGFALAGTSSNPSVADLGLLLGRGTILSMIMVICFLPAMLRLLDKPIGKSTYKARFFRGKEEAKTKQDGCCRKEI